MDIKSYSHVGDYVKDVIGFDGGQFYAVAQGVFTNNSRSNTKPSLREVLMSDGPLIPPNAVLNEFYFFSVEKGANISMRTATCIIPIKRGLRSDFYTASDKKFVPIGGAVSFLFRNGGAQNTNYGSLYGGSSISSFDEKNFFSADEFYFSIKHHNQVESIVSSLNDIDKNVFLKFKGVVDREYLD
ncbi:hypothetical protein K9L67_05085 [Candidatus Woesearchaeota archaeon]|nr:hypothetical protein [Candidatus Woesearchaeota archaeon]MCF7901572.1 hypothetical protein [Candidatus Woesearchaeota archaeon]MCF8013971.1 hypothetical protein [Candidatus Woesearchaeota archaeon]